MSTKETSVVHKWANSLPASRPTRPLVRYLLLPSRPAAILWGVIAVVIDTVQRMIAGWLPPHVGKEVLELLPTLTDRDAASSVIFPVPTARIPTAFKHGVPRIVFRPSAFTASCTSMKDIHAPDYSIEVRCT